MLLSEQYYLEYRSTLYNRPLHITLNNVNKLLYGLDFESALRFRKEDVGYLGSWEKLEDAMDVVRSKIICRVDKPFEAHVRKVDSLNRVHTIILHDIPSTEILLRHFKYNGTERIRGTLSTSRTLSNVKTMVFNDLMFPRNPLTYAIADSRFEYVFSSLKKYFAPSSLCLHLPRPYVLETVGYRGHSMQRSNIRDLKFVKEWIEEMSPNLKADQLVIHNVYYIVTSIAKLFANVKIYLSPYHIFNVPVSHSIYTTAYPQFHEVIFRMLCDQLPTASHGKIEIYNAGILKAIPLERFLKEARRRYPGVILPCLKDLEDRLAFYDSEETSRCEMCESD
ncbi:hypothetical protein I302_106558 [Kwoniella bestiolae CBS 10118]|uniref:Uncharacterized protein n=1 Tax=Kwoniella bestiolae CBS 10118 TaxID=1296100 RepID=A0A1B9G129_9TREE|nr:hypothetical protein I302_06180 [Kwoniella bestiolae CBS 10118]OCF24719.1 hypothetical protein I302_06180 [Kwoniella bestiolae CBS 10118]